MANTRIWETGVLPAALTLALAGPTVAAECNDDAFAGLNSATTRVTTEMVTEGTVVATARRQEVVAPSDFCRVIGNINGNINFEVWLPFEESWNGKLNVHGNGGLAGSIGHGNLAEALELNFATASTDTGHSNADGPAWPLVDGQLSEELLTDWAYRAHYLTTLAARDVIGAYYGSEPQYSYFTGCSGAGAHGLQMAQKYPDLFDGIEVGAPANFQTGLWPGELYPSLVTHRDAGPGGQCMPTACESGPDEVICGDALEPQGAACPSMVPPVKLTALREVAIEACDGLDGLEDGLIEDPLMCTFDPRSMVCPAGMDSASCLTPDQAESIARIYEGLRDPATGEQIWPGYEPGSEDGWGGHIGEPFFISRFYFQILVFEDPEWDWREFINNDAYIDAIREGHERFAPVIAAIDPDLSAFKANGGKMVLWHGWDDPNIAPRNSINYYEDVLATMGGTDETDDFLRLFMVPGMKHCNNGAGFHDFDAFGALQAWVEEGAAPEAIEAFSPQKEMARPLCAYPDVPRLRESGLDPAVAENFVCMAP